MSIRKIKRRRFRAYIRGRLTKVRDRDCSGIVAVDVKVKKRRVILRRTRVKRSCRWSRKMTFSARRIPRKLRVKRRQRFTVASRYGGSPSLKPVRKVNRVRSKR